MRRFARLWGFAAFVVVVALLFREVLLPFVFAVTVAYILAPAVNRMSSWKARGRHLPRGLAVIICYLGLLAVMVLFFGAFLPRLSGDFARLGREAPKLWDRANKDFVPRVARWLEHRFPSLAPAPPVGPPEPPPGPINDVPAPPGTIVTITPLPSGDYAIALPPEGIQVERSPEGHMVIRPREVRPKKRLEEIFRERMVKGIASLEGQVAGVLRFGQAIITGVITAIMKAVLVLMVAAFILIDLARIHRMMRSIIPDTYRGDYDVVVAGIDRGLNGVIRGQLLICLINGVLTYVGLLIFQVKYGLLLAALAGVMSLIPIFGSILSSIPIVGIALVSGSAGVDPLRGVFVLAWILGIHFVEANVLSPQIMGSAAKIHPVLVIFALIAGEHTFGLVGALLAVPVASIIQTLFVFFRRKAWKTDTASVPVPAAK